MYLAEMVADALERGITRRADEAIDEYEVWQVVCPCDRAVVDDENQLGHAEQPLQRLRRPIERRVPR